MIVRSATIDLLRTLAIFLMVIVHFVENLSGSDWVPGGFAAPLFTFLVGVSYRQWMLAQEAKGWDELQISRASLRRGGFLIVVGLVFNVVVWLPADMFNWDVLTLIGTALVVLSLLRNTSPVVPLLFACVVFLLGPVIREAAVYREYWPEGYFDPDWNLPDVMVGYLATGYFPVFPWLAYPLIGFVTGIAYSAHSGEAPRTGAGILLGAGLLVLAAAAVAVHSLAPSVFPEGVLSGWTMFPPSVEYATGTIGGSLLMFSLGLRWIDPNVRMLEGTRLLAVAGTFSKYSLSIYIFHHVIHLWPLWVYGWSVGNEPTEFWRRALPEWAAIALACVSLLLTYCLFRWMDRTKREGLEGWMRRICG